MRTKRFTVAPGHEFNYPADKQSQTIVKQVGGRRNLSPEQKKLVSYKTTAEGEDCSDMPADTRDLYVERGWILVSEEAPKKQEEPLEEPLKEGD